MLLFMSFHFTQSCAFIEYFVSFYGLLFVLFTAAKIHIFSKMQVSFRFFLYKQNVI